MKGDVCEAAFRLAQTLTVRTHERKPYAHVQGSKNVQPVIINGRRFPSIAAVKHHYHVCTQTVHDWLASGRAQRK